MIISQENIFRVFPFIVMGFNVIMFWYSRIDIGRTINQFTLEEMKMRLKRSLRNKGGFFQYDLDGASNIEMEQPNLPVAFYFNYLNDVQPSRDNKDICAVLPNIFDIRHNNRFWQVIHLKTSPKDVEIAGYHHRIGYLYSAFLDKRKLATIGGGWWKGPTIRVLAMLNFPVSGAPKNDLYCQLWVKGSQEPVLSKVLYIDWAWQNSWGWSQEGRLQPHVISCPLPHHEVLDRANHQPATVSIIEGSPCGEATNLLHLHYDKPIIKHKHDFAVCVKALSYPDSDLSVQLAEWIEVQLALGVWSITIYKMAVHPNMEQVLHHYAKAYPARIQVIETSLPGEQPNTPHLRHLYLKNKINTKRQNEVLIYNDCFMRNMYSVRYVALLDIDELIIPNDEDVTTWADMLRNIRMGMTDEEKTEWFDAYCFNNVYFFTGGSKASPFFRTYQRSTKFSPEGEFAKCFHSTELVEVVHNHQPLLCMSGEDTRNCTVYFVEPSVAKLHHYKETCVGILESSCHEYTQSLTADEKLKKYANIENKARNTLREMDL